MIILESSTNKQNVAKHVQSQCMQGGTSLPPVGALCERKKCKKRLNYIGHEYNSVTHVSVINIVG